MLKDSGADTVVAAVGSFPFDVVIKEYPSLRQLIWVVDEGSKHLDWNEVPKGMGGKINVSTWQEIIEDDKSTTSDVPAVDSTNTPADLVAFWPSKSGYQLVSYTQANLVAAISGQLSSIPTNQRISPADLFLPADSLSTVYTLVLTLASLYFNASIALNSVAGLSDLALATQGVAPTIIVASATTLAKLQAETQSKLRSAFYRTVHWLQTRTLTQNGVMPLASTLTQYNDSLRPVIGTTPGKLRLVFVSEQAGADTPPLSPLVLSDLRIFTGARVIYALTAAKVAGAVAQTGFYDYRVEEGLEGKHSHFGAPVTSVEVFLRDKGTAKTTDGVSQGEVSVYEPYMLQSRSDRALDCG
jgi:hypothetical protein